MLLCLLGVALVSLSVREPLSPQGSHRHPQLHCCLLWLFVTDFPQENLKKLPHSRETKYSPFLVLYNKGHKLKHLFNEGRVKNTLDKLFSLSEWGNHVCLFGFFFFPFYLLGQVTTLEATPVV